MEEKTIIGYKGFNRNLTCHGGFQYEKGKTFEYNGKIKLMRSGLHFCENPLDVLRFYFMSYYCRLCRFFVVEASGEIEYAESSYRISCASRLRLIKELSIRDLMELGVQSHPSEFVGSTHHSVCSDKDEEIISTHRLSTVISTLGKWNKVFVAGDTCMLCNFGDSSQLYINSQINYVYNEGNNCIIIIYGNNNHILNKGDNCIIVDFGDMNYIRNKGEGSSLFYRDATTSFWNIKGTLF